MTGGPDPGAIARCTSGPEVLATNRPAAALPAERCTASSWAGDIGPGGIAGARVLTASGLGSLRTERSGPVEHADRASPSASCSRRVVIWGPPTPRMAHE